MTQCEYQEFPCLSGNYNEFDNIINRELKLNISAGDVTTKSNYCISMHIDLMKIHDILDVNDYLSTLKRKMGIYQLWREVEECQDHELYLMECIYVGKGFAKDRIKDHIDNKWNPSEFLYISFYECENRIAKYIEQLFLDTYKFELNKAENKGTHILYARWNHERLTLGTEANEIANKLSNKKEFKEFEAQCSGIEV